MLTVAQACERISSETDVNASLVTRIARALINAGFLPKARGRDVPTITPPQACQILLAVAATDRPNEAAPMMTSRWQAKTWDSYDFPPEGAETMPRGTHLGVAITEILIDLMNLDRRATWDLMLWSKIDVSRTFPEVRLRFNECRLKYAEYANTEQPVFSERQIMPENGINVVASIPGQVLQSLAAGLIGMSVGEARREMERRADWS